MAVSIYTDEARLKRYEKLLRQKEKADQMFGKSLLFAVIIAVTESIGNVVAGPAAWMLGNAQAKFPGLSALAVVVTMAFAVFSIVRRERWLIFAAMAAVILCFAAGWFTFFQIGLIEIVPLGISLAASFTWHKLKSEEGFPRFQIDIEEHEVRTKSQVSYIEKRALDAGIRQEQAALDPHAQMTDLMDAGTAPQYLGAKLHNYHERCRNSDAVVQVKPRFGTEMETVEQKEQLEEI